MRCRRYAAAGLAVALLAAPGCAALRKNDHTPVAPAQNVRMDSEVLEEFLEGIHKYVKLHKELTARIPVAEPSWSAQQIADRQRQLTVAIQNARREKREGNIFKPEVAQAFRHVLSEEFSGPEGPNILHEIRSNGNPQIEGVPQQRNPRNESMKAVRLQVNAYYPDDAPLSSVPPTQLLRLPALPEEVRYRFVGRALILRDTEANVILDFLRDVVPDTSIPR
jgi:hypothetical protein